MSKEWLGLQATDRISGFTGTVTAITTYLTGPDRIAVTPKVTEPSKPVDAAWFYPDELELPIA